MTLKEKFAEVELERGITSRLEQIADEFAIEFAEWLIKKQTNYFESLKELLEQFKKEKGL